MKRSYVILLMLYLVFNSITVWAFPGEIVTSFPAPGKFCSGMTYDGNSLWLADYKNDKLYQMDVNTGKILKEIPSPGFWPMDLAWDGKTLWNVDKKQKKIFQVDPDDGKILNTIDSPSNTPEGLTWDGVTLWIGDVKQKKIMKLDLSDGTAVKTIDAPSQSANGLTFDGTYLWCADRKSDELYMIEPDDGEVIIILKSPGPYPRGLAWDGENIWNVDYQNDAIYKIIRKDKDLYQLTETRKAKVTFTHQVKIYGKGSLKNLNTYIAIPENLPQQKIVSKTFFPKEFNVEKDKWNQNIAIFNYKDMESESQIESIMEVESEISNIRYFIFPDLCASLREIPKEISSMYTSDESKYMIGDPFIQDLAQKIVGDEGNPYWVARKIFDYVRNNLEYKLEGGWNIAPVVLKRGTGSCSEYTFSFIALCRAAGLPARYVGAIVVRGDDASLDEVFHRWPEVYLPNYGWVPIDPQGGDKDTPRDRANYIGNLSNRFLITTQGGGDSAYLGWYYNYNESYQTDPQVQISIETFGEWEPISNE